MSCSDVAERPDLDEIDALVNGIGPKSDALRASGRMPASIDEWASNEVFRAAVLIRVRGLSDEGARKRLKLVHGALDALLQEGGSE